MRIEHLIEKGLLRKEAPDNAKSYQSLVVSGTKLKEAQKALNAGIFEAAIVFSYMSMFHAARALLFKDGYLEKSHFAVVVFLKEKYSPELGSSLISKFNTCRSQRHEGLYGLEAEFSNEDATNAVDDAKEFTGKIRMILQKQTLRKEDAALSDDDLDAVREAEIDLKTGKATRLN